MEKKQEAYSAPSLSAAAHNEDDLRSHRLMRMRAQGGG